MSKTIWKFPLDVTSTQVVPMPVGARVLCAQLQQGQLCLWAVVDPEAERRSRVVQVAGIGHRLPDAVCDGFDYVGTAQARPFVWHVFLQKEES